MRGSGARLVDIVAAAEAIAGHLARGDLDDGLVFDAVRVRLIEIGEAVKAIDPAALADEAGVPWQDIAGMRDHLAHRCFDTDHARCRPSDTESDNLILCPRSVRPRRPGTSPTCWMRSSIAVSTSRSCVEVGRLLSSSQSVSGEGLG